MLYFVGRALLKQDRPTFALHLVHGIHPDLFQPVRKRSIMALVDTPSFWNRGVRVVLSRADSGMSSLVSISRKCSCLTLIPSLLLRQKEWEIFTGQLGSAAAVANGGRPRGFPPWGSPDQEEAFALLVEHLPSLIQACDLEDAGR